MAGPPDFDSGAFVAEGQQRIDNQKKALLDVIAQQGQAGAATYAQGQAQINTYGDTARQSAMANQAGSAISDPGYAGAEEGRRQSMLNMYRADMTAGSTSFASDMARQAAAGGQYMSEASASLPSVAAGVQRDIEGIKGKIEEERQRRAHEAQMRAMALEAQRMEMARAEKGDANGDLERRILEQRVAAGDRELAAPPEGDPDAEIKFANSMKWKIDQEVDRLDEHWKQVYDNLYRGRDPLFGIKGKVITDTDKLHHLQDLVRDDHSNKAVLAQYGVSS